MQNNKPVILLVSPEIPQNTGNIIRLCANIGFALHLIKPLGFPLDDAKLKRAGLDYHEYTNITTHENWEYAKTYFNNKNLIAIETSGNTYYNDYKFSKNDVLIFGSETKGLSKNVLQNFKDNNILKIPMCTNQRSLNLSNAVAIVAFEAWRQLKFTGSTV